MAISKALNSSMYGSMGGPLDALLAQVRKSVNGQQYTIEELKEYIKEHPEEFTKKAVKKRLTDMLSGMSAEELKEQNDIGVLHLKKGDNMLVLTGNPLYMAIYLKDEALIRGMMEKKVPLVAAGRHTLCSELGAITTIAENYNLLCDTLLENPAGLSEELWIELWKYYAEQSRMNREALQLGTIMGKNWEHIMLWFNNFLTLKNKYPDIYKMAISEELFHKILLAVCQKDVEEEPLKEERREMSRLLKKLNYPLKRSELLWEQVMDMETKARDSFYNWAVLAKRYMNLWKKLSGQPIVAEMQGALREYCNRFFETSGNNFNGFGAFEESYTFLDCLLDAVDVVKYPEQLNGAQMILYLMKEDKEEQLIGALRIGLISGSVLQKAIRYATENHISRVMPLLILKSHGEWTPEAEYDV